MSSEKSRTECTRDASRARLLCLLVLRNYVGDIRHEVREAAELDGCSRAGILWRIYLPLSGSSLAVLFLFQFTWIWNDLLFGITLADSTRVRPVMAALATLQGVYGATDIPAVLASAIVASLPTRVLFVGLQLHCMEGLRLSATG